MKEAFGKRAAMDPNLAERRNGEKNRAGMATLRLLTLVAILLSSLAIPASSKIIFVGGDDPAGDIFRQAVENGEDDDDGQEDGSSAARGTDHPEGSTPSAGSRSFDDFSEEELPGSEGVKDPGSWKLILDSKLGSGSGSGSGSSGELSPEQHYISGMQHLLGANHTPVNLTLAVSLLNSAANLGHPHAQSSLAFLYSNGYGVEMDSSLSFLYHTLAAEGGSLQSKLALAYINARQKEFDKAVQLYAELAQLSVIANRVPGQSPLVEMVKLNTGLEESQEAMRGHRGENDETLQYFEFLAKANDIHSLQTMGTFFYYGARGLERDHVRAFNYFKRAAELGDATSMCHLAEMYAFGIGTVRDPAESLRLFKKAQKVGFKSSDIYQQHSALASYTGIGYLYLHGLGVKRNLTHALTYFREAAGHKEPDALYYLGMMQLRGLGTKVNIQSAINHFVDASKTGHLGSVFQIGKLHHQGRGVVKNTQEATFLYKPVTEKGPWGNLLQLAHSYYIKGQIYQSLILYSRAAELGYEVAQSNAAWLLDRFGKDSGCFGSNGSKCSEEERNLRSHRLWRHSSEQGNDQAALLIGDAYFYGKGTKKDLELAAEAYLRASNYKSESSAHASFNLGYMYEHGLGLPVDLHLAKRYYDQALEKDENAALPVKISLFMLWFRQKYPSNQLLQFIDKLPESFPKIQSKIIEFVSDDGMATIITLLALLIAVLFLRNRPRTVTTAPPNNPQ